jgi:hypothetical protein
MQCFDDYFKTQINSYRIRGQVIAYVKMETVVLTADGRYIVQDKNEKMNYCRVPFIDLVGILNLKSM